MQKLSLVFFLVFFLFFVACNSGKTDQPVSTASADSVNIFPVTSFLKAQLKELDTMPVTPLLVVTVDGKKDSVWLKREDIRKNATAFLSPEIDSVHMNLLYKESSFLDQTINAYTFSYDPKKDLPDSVHLTHWDVYMNSQTNAVQRIYLVKEKDSGNANVTRQLTWLVNKWYSIRTITQIPNHQPEIKEEKMIWDFDN